MERTHLDPERPAATEVPPADFAEDLLIEMADLDAQDTGVPGTIFVSTALGAHGPQVKWCPARAGGGLPPAGSRPATPPVIAWVRLNHAALLDFWENGAAWTRREVPAFLDVLQRLP